MDFRELVARRYSVRAYKQKDVEEESLNRILEAARLAPTASNLQPFQIIVVRTAGREKELRRIYWRDWFVQAPIVICVCGLPGQAWVRKDGRNYCDIDAAIVMDHMILAATELGLGTCWIAAFDAAVAREVLAIPAGVEPLLFTPLGYAADEPVLKERKPLANLVRFL